MNASDVAVFAITDYWTFDGFKKLMEVNAELPADKRLGKTVLPGIELRFDILTDEEDPSDKTRVNFQVIFNDDDGYGLYRINQFYSQLKLSSTPKVISKDSFVEIAKDYPDDVLEKLVGKNRKQCQQEDYLIAGYKSCYVSYDCLDGILKNPELRNNLFIVVPWDKYGGIGKIDPILRDDIKKKLTKLANALESTKDDTIRLFLLDKELLATKSWAGSWKQFLDNDEKPCVCGSDAKNVENVGVFPNAKACWIKADTTFEGLKQVMFEPRDRVYVGSDDPSAYKYSVIDSFSVSAENDAFFFKGVGEIQFNAGLNCVAGPRGAGKSTFLDVIAMSLGYSDVLNEDRNNYAGFFFRAHDRNIVNATVRHSSIGGRKELSADTAKDSGFLFDYYYQKHIGCLADPNNEEILSRFLFEKIFKEGQGLDSVFDELGEKRDEFVSKLAINRETSVACEKEIAKESDVRAKITDKTNRAQFLSQEEIKHLLKERGKIIKLREQVRRIKTRIDKITEEPLVIKDALVDAAFFSDLRLSLIDPEGTIVPRAWKELESDADGFVASLGKTKEGIEVRVGDFAEKVSKLAPTFKFDEQLDDIWDQIQAESKKKGIAITKNDLERLDTIQKEIAGLEKQLETIETQKNEQKKLLDERRNLLKEYNDYLNSVKTNLEINFNELLKKDGAILEDTIRLELDISLSMESYLTVIENQAQHEESERFPNKKSLLELFKSLGAEKVVRDLRNNYFEDWTGRGFGSGGLDYFKKMINKEEVAMYLEEALPNLTSRLTWRPDSSKAFKQLKNCSIGERGTALLSVILIAGREPLIIDQPEDDLDHFYLYKTLTPIIKEVKKRRQLVFATHDANIVINGDAELILIVATEDGRYGDVTTASIENLKAREKVMDILEGGRDAFRRREQKYNLAYRPS
jgi:ABC-type lipoprotein export system ATPase subunit